MSIKRTIITTILALALVVTVAPAAQADTLSDLMAQIAALQAQIATLQGGSTATGTGLCAGVTFTRNLIVGSTGSDVKCLQQILSVTPTSGYFGPLTLAAVRQYQAEKGMTPANQVGPMTRAALNAGLTATGTGTGTGTGTTTGATGFLSVSSVAAAPADNANITATSNVPVYGLNLKAIGSDMRVSSAKVLLYTTKSAAVEHPSILIKNLYVYDGSALLGTYPVNTSTVIKDGSNYYVILSGFSFVVPVNTTKVLTVTADFAPSLETDRVLEVALLDSNSIRATDGSGVNSTSGLNTTISSGNPSTYNRTYTVNYDSVGTSTLTVSANTATPKSTSVNINTDNGTTGVPMLVFNTKSTTGASVITDVVVKAQGDNTAVAKVTGISLYDGSTLLGSQALSSAVSGATATFSDLTINVAKDAIKSLTVKADFAADVTDSSSIYLSIASGAVTYQKPDLATATTTGTSTGNAMYLFDGKAAVLSFVSSSSSYTYNTTTPSLSYSTGVITFRVTADGGTLTALTNSTVKVKWNSTILSTSNVSVDVSPAGDTADGSQATVTVTMTVPRSTSSTGFVNFNIYEIDWSVGGTSATQTWGLSDDYKTPYVNVQ